jgi:beta-galactosidase
MFMKATLRPRLSPSGQRHLVIAIFFILNFLATFAPAADPVRERLCFNSDWRFTRDDPAGMGNGLSYTNIKPWVTATGNEFVLDGKPAERPSGNPGGDVAYTQPGYDASAWRQLNLPHDWGMEGPFKQEAPGSTGKLPWEGVGWYRKHFTVPASDKDRRLCLEVDGAMSYANVWLNGQYVGGWPYGYSSWQLDLTPYIKAGADNVVAIRLDNPPASSRWYPGGGIYRNVWLLKTGPMHVAHWGTYVTTPEVSSFDATAKIQATLDNDTDTANVVSVKNEIYELGKDDTKGASVAKTTAEGVQIAAHSNQTVEAQATIKNPKLWSLKTPNRYVVVTTISQDGNVLDSYETPFGIRTIKFDANQGFFLNGEHVRLNGVCNHADLGALGTAINFRALQRQVEILQDMGCNAIRTSHNPPAPELLDLCDRMGMLVMDESFDCWQKGKRTNDYHLLFNDWHEKDWRAELRRDRNHPSVILWSIGNEVPDQGTPAGPGLAAELTRIAREEDPTRPTTAACDHPSSGFNGFQTNLDVFGYNYKPFLYAKVHAANPGLPIFGSETASCISSRGEYFYPVSTNKADGRSDFQMSSYDLSAPPWATIPDTEFKGQDENPFVAGEFVWTGFDYLGEPTPYDGPDDPSRSSYFGIVDLAGLKKDRFYLYQARWRPELPMAHLVPQCWNWPDRAGQITPVFVYSSGDSAELFLNGKSLGLKKTEPYEYRLCWNDLKYEPGKLRVVAYKNGKRWATDELQTTGPAAKLALQTDRNHIRANGEDLSFVTLVVEDKHDLVVPQAGNAIHFEISGPGEIVATDNGDATDLVSFPSHDRKAFNGRCLAIIRAKPGQTGTIKLTAGADHLKMAKISIKAE